MTAAAKKAFVLRMAAARAKAKKKPAPVKKTPAPKKKASPPKARSAPRPAKKAKAKKNGPALKSVLRDTKTRRNVKTFDTRKDALAVARRKNETEGYKRYTVNNATPGRRNPDTMSEAERMYADFHGRPHTRTVEHTDAHSYRSELAELGRLIFLKVKVQGGHADLQGFGNSCQVACTPDGANIYFLGGSQGIDLAAFDIDSDKDFVELGECTYIEYYTVKGFHNFDPMKYFHHFGEEDGIRPILAFDTINKKLFLIGGNYECKPEGIRN